MSYGTTALLPVLYDISHDAEAFFKKYGPVVSFDGPNKTANIQFLTNVADKLRQYARICGSIDDQKKQQKRMCLFYMVLGLVLAVVVLGVPYVVSVFKRSGKRGLVDWLNLGTFCPLIMLVVYAIINVYRRNVHWYDVAYNHAAMDQDDNVIADLVGQFQVVHEHDTDEDLTYVRSNNPLMVYYYAQQHPDEKVALDPDMAASAPDASWCTYRALSGQALGDFMDKCMPADHKGAMYPFVDGSSYNPVVLQKTLQKYDAYGQVSRLASAVAWFKGFLLKSSDEVYGGAGAGGGASSADHSKVVQSIAALFTSGFVQVTDLAITGDGVASTQSTKQAFVHMCLTHKDCLAASFDEATSMCKMLTRTNVADGTGKLVFSPGNTNTVLLHSVQPTSDRVAVTGSTVDSKVLSEQFTQASQGACPLDGTAAPGCLVPTQQTNWMDAQQASIPSLTYDQVFGGKGAAAVPLVYMSRFADIVAKQQRTTLDATLRENKAALTDVVVDVILDMDSSNTFQLTQGDMDLIAQAVQPINDLAVMPLADILMDVPAKLQARYASAQQATEDEELQRYIPYERFLDKLKDMTSKEFVVDFVSNAEEIRATSSGLHTLRNKFDSSREMHVQQAHLNDVTLSLSLIAACSAWGGYGLHTIARLTHDPKDPGGDATKSEGLILSLNKEMAVMQRHVLDLGAQLARTGGTSDRAWLQEEIARTQSQLRKLKADKQNTVWTQVAVQLTAAIAILLVYMVLRATTLKRNAIWDYNQAILETNGSNLAQDGRAIMQLLFDDMRLNRYGINKSAASSTTTSASSNVGNSVQELDSKHVAYNAFTDRTLADASEEEYFDVIVKSTTINDKVNIQPADAAGTYELYLKLIRVLETHDKCNSLTAGYNGMMPAPVMELCMYGVVFVVSMVVMLYIAGQFKPVQRLVEVRRLMRAQNRMKLGGLLPAEDYGVEDQDDPDNLDALLIVKYAGLAALLLFALVFAATIQSNARRFTTALYGTADYRKNKCYKG